jgi:hypothetical protein
MQTTGWLAGKKKIQRRASVFSQPVSQKIPNKPGLQFLILSGIKFLDPDKKGGNYGDNPKTLV